MIDLGTFKYPHLKAIVNYSKGDKRPLDKKIQRDAAEIFHLIAPSIDKTKWSLKKCICFYLNSWLFNKYFMDDIINDVASRLDSTIKKDLYIKRHQLSKTKKEVDESQINEDIINNWYKNTNAFDKVKKSASVDKNKKKEDLEKECAEDLSKINSCKHPCIQAELNALNKKLSNLLLSDEKGYNELKSEIALLREKATILIEAENFILYIKQLPNVNIQENLDKLIEDFDSSNHSKEAAEALVKELSKLNLSVKDFIKIFDEIDENIQSIKNYEDKWVKGELQNILEKYFSKSQLNNSDYEEIKSKTSALLDIVKQFQVKDSEKQKISEEKKVTSKKYEELLKVEADYQNKLTDLEKIKVKISKIENIETFGKSEAQIEEEVNDLNQTRKSSILSLGNYLDGAKLKEYTKNKTDLHELHLKIAAAEVSVNTYKPFRLETNRQIEIQNKTKLLNEAEELQHQSKSLVEATIKEKRDSLNKQIVDHDQSISKIDLEIQLIKDRYNGKSPSSDIDTKVPSANTTLTSDFSETDSSRQNSATIARKDENIDKLKQAESVINSDNGKKDETKETSKPGLKSWEQLTPEEKKQFKQHLTNHPTCNIPQLYKSFGDSKSPFNQFLIDANKILSDALFGVDRKEGEDILGIQQLSEMSKLWKAAGSEENGIDKYDEKGFDDAVGYIYDYYIKIKIAAKNKTSLSEILKSLQNDDIYYDTKNLKTHKVVQKAGTIVYYTPDISEIANDYGVSVDVLLEFNPKIKINSKLVLGTELKIPLPKQRNVNLDKISELKEYPGFLEARGKKEIHSKYNEFLETLLGEKLTDVPQDVKLLLIDLAYYFNETISNAVDNSYSLTFDTVYELANVFDSERNTWLSNIWYYGAPVLIKQITSKTVNSLLPSIIALLDKIGYGPIKPETKLLNNAKDALLKEQNDKKLNDYMTNALIRSNLKDEYSEYASKDNDPVINYDKKIKQLDKNIEFSNSIERKEFNAKGMEKTNSLIKMTVKLVSYRHDCAKLAKLINPLTTIIIALCNHSLCQRIKWFEYKIDQFGKIQQLVPKDIERKQKKIDIGPDLKIKEQLTQEISTLEKDKQQFIENAKSKNALIDIQKIEVEIQKLKQSNEEKTYEIIELEKKKQQLLKEDETLQAELKELQIIEGKIKDIKQSDDLKTKETLKQEIVDLEKVKKYLVEKIELTKTYLNTAKGLVKKSGKEKLEDAQIHYKKVLQNSVSEFITKALPIIHTVACEVGKDPSYGTILSKADKLIDSVNKDKELLPEVFPAEKLDVFMQKLLQIIK